MPHPTDVLAAVSLGKTQVAIQTMSHVIAVQQLHLPAALKESRRLKSSASLKVIISVSLPFKTAG
jgi:hypothetical protein